MFILINIILKYCGFKSTLLTINYIIRGYSAIAGGRYLCGIYGKK